LDNLEPQTHPLGPPSWLPADVHFIQGDVRDPRDVDVALQGAEYVFHLAAFGGFTDDVRKYFDVNATGTACVLEGIRRAGSVQKLVVASSQGVYGEGLYETPDGARRIVPLRTLKQLEAGEWEQTDPVTSEVLVPVPATVDKPAESPNPYSISKHAGERLALGLGRQWELPVCALRYSVTYGPRQSVYNPYTGVVSIFSTQLLNDRAPHVYEDGNQTRDFIYVEDNARGNLFAMEHSEATGRAFNLATGRATRVCEIIDILASLFGKDLGLVVTGRFRPNDVRHLVLDTSDLAALGFSATTDLRTGLARSADWMRAQGEVEDRFSTVQSALIESGVVREP
jgi:dTDP-L-rhamnose 4-epimerase